MKKIKQMLALVGVVLLVGLYLSTLVCALIDNDNYMNLLMVSIYATVIIPVLLWAYSFIYRLVKKQDKDNMHDETIAKTATDTKKQ